MKSQGPLPDCTGLTGLSRDNKARLTRAALWTLACLPVLASSAWSQSTSFRIEDIRAALNESNRAAGSESSMPADPVAALASYSAKLPAGHPPVGGGEVHEGGSQPLLDYVEQLEAGRPKLIAAQPQGRTDGRDEIYSNLMEFAREIAPQQNIQLAAVAKPVKTVTKVAVDAEATFVGGQVCLGCHASHAAAFNLTVMGRIFRNPRTAQEKGGCETCHGAGSLHVKAGGGRGVGGIISFRKNDTTRTVADNNAICLSCHDKGDRHYWQGSVHETRNVACTDCHTVMTRVSVRGQLKTEREVDTCYQCHKDRRMQAQRSSHMPLREGKMTCTSCHNPHGTANDAMLKQVSVNDNCYQCHAEKRGPFLWEHPPVRENCLNCHEAHGSNLEYLLKVQRPRLCQDCHSIGHASQSPLVNTAFNRSCQNCHSQIHGSNHPSGVLFQR